MGSGAPLPVGDGAIARNVIEQIIVMLRQFAGPTGARGSILLMTGGLVILGFLFTAFIFRSAVVGDLAPSAHPSARVHRAALPPSILPRVTAAGPEAFGQARAQGREATGGFDDLLATMARLGMGEPRVLHADSTTMRIRVYAAGAGACERVRGYLVGAMERSLGSPVKCDEVVCRVQGGAHCEYVVRHPYREVPP